MRFNHAEFAEHYHKQMIEAGYPGKLLPFVIDNLEGYGTVLDIGSGTGFFSIPLAGAGHLVTAVEPSEEMSVIMKRNIPSEILPSINICGVSWENWEGKFHDAAMCIHSLYPMDDAALAIKKMNKSAGKKIIIVRDSKMMRTLPGKVREKFGILSNRDLNEDIMSVLDEVSGKWEMINLHEERKYIINDLRLEAASIIYQLKLDKSTSDEVLAILEDELNYKGGNCFFNAIYSDNAYIF